MALRTLPSSLSTKIARCRLCVYPPNRGFGRDGPKGTCREHLLVSPETVIGMAVHSTKAMLHGKGHDVWEMAVENIPGRARARLLLPASRTEFAAAGAAPSWPGCTCLIAKSHKGRTRRATPCSLTVSQCLGPHDQRAIARSTPDLQIALTEFWTRGFFGETLQSSIEEPSETAWLASKEN